MRATVLPYAIILTIAHRAAVSTVAKRSIVTGVLPNYIHVYAIVMQ